MLPNLVTNCDIADISLTKDAQILEVDGSASFGHGDLFDCLTPSGSGGFASETNWMGSVNHAVSSSQDKVDFGPLVPDPFDPATYSSMKPEEFWVVDAVQALQGWPIPESVDLDLQSRGVATPSRSMLPPAVSNDWFLLGSSDSDKKIGRAHV